MAGDIENIVGTQDVEPEKKSGGGNGDARRQIIWEAKLLGMTEIQAQQAEISKELSENLKTAGRDIIAVKSAYDIYNLKLMQIRATHLQIFGEQAIAGLKNFKAAWDESMNAADATMLANGILSLQEGIASAFSPDGPVTEAIAWQIEYMGSFHAAWMAAGAGVSEGLIGISTVMDETLPRWGAFWQSASAGVDSGTAAAVEGITAVEGALSAAGKALEAGQGGVGAALAAGRALTVGLLKNVKQQALLLGAFEVAEAIKSGAELNFIAAAAHGLAAVKYFAVAGSGGGGNAASSVARDQRREAAGPRITGAPAGQRGPTQIVQNLFSTLDKTPPGQIVADALNETGRKRTGVRLDAGLVSDNAYSGGY